MKKLLISPSQMNLSDADNLLYQNILKLVPDISLNLMAVKVENHPKDFAGWCEELLDVCQNRINFSLLEDKQLPVVKKMAQQLQQALTLQQLKMLRIAPWPVLATFINNKAEQLALNEQLALVNYLSSIKEQPLEKMIEEDKLAYAGKHTANHDPSVYQFDVEWFCSTKAAKAFHLALTECPHKLDSALSHIPLEGDISYEQYAAFISEYLAAFVGLDDDKATLAPATRLLAMRRPDFFITLSQAKLELLSQALGVVKLNNRDFQRYWDDVLMTVHTMPWFQSSLPESEQEQTLWHIKALLPSLFFYSDLQQAENSNYLKLLNKPKKASATGNLNKGQKRGKDSAEILVDRALTAEDIPEHIKNMRDSIVAEVVKGRSVNETIALMRTIFG
ncbi:hypothetical protein [Pseudoalteromonas ulvae]|uniref:Orphan protein n=1 Tax=Pseudoalteromonas ulvae TaxID=107327 RepID=A0A244CKZ0_PSEDV|nr:hypothetical protein [Pseudoalteromonas ulvae]OUL56041.1 hypothetical protein B1199_20275 [Pseudoalteromonas ulvae]